MSLSLKSMFSDRSKVVFILGHWMHIRDLLAISQEINTQNGHNVYCLNNVY